MIMEYQKVTRISGIRYYRCQHLKEGAQQSEQAAWFIGENQRLIVCPLCDKMHIGNMLVFVANVAGNMAYLKDDIEKDVQLTKLFLGDKK